MSAIFAERRTWLGLGLLVAVLVVVAGWFTLISPMRADTASLVSQETDARAQNAVLTQKLVVLKKQKDGLPALRADLGTQVRGLPTSSGLPELTRQLTDQAKTARVGIKSLAVGAVTAVVKPAAAAGTSTAAAATTTAAGQLFAIPVTLTTTGPAKRQIAFLKALQQVGPRRALVISTTFAPGGSASATGTAAAAPATTSIGVDSTMTTVLTVFSAPISPDDQAQLTRLIAGTSTS